MYTSDHWSFLAPCNANGKPSFHLLSPLEYTTVIPQLSRPILHFFERIFDRIILPQVHLLSLLCDLVLDKDFLRMLRHKLPNESWIP